MLLGLAARVPGLNGVVVNRGTGGTDRAAYCYQVWLKHLVLLHASGMSGIPRVVAELGPGDSIGVGLAALLCGAEKYLSLDVKPHATAERNERILGELVELLEGRSPLELGEGPGAERAERDGPFPGAILPDEWLRETLASHRIEAIREALRGEAVTAGVEITSRAPWQDVDVERESVDLILSHSVMEHVEDLEEAYAACAAWLRPGGWMSHQVDFTSHGLARKWNGHWACSSERYWRILAGKRDCWINRQPVSRHVNLIGENGFELAADMRSWRDDGVDRSGLAPRWRSLSDEDLRCSAALLLDRRVRVEVGPRARRSPGASGT